MIPLSPLSQTDAPPLRVCGHFGELMQGRLGKDGPIVLISLPCNRLWVEVGDTPDPGLIGPQRLEKLWAALGLPHPVPQLSLRATMPQGGGAGSSTAALVAAASLAGFAGSANDLARACVAAEGASDPLMFEHAERLLFAPRLGEVVDRLPRLPAFDVIGGFWGPEQRTDPQDMRFPDISDLVDAWRRTNSLSDVASLASESARRTLNMRGPLPDPTEALAKELGAEGWVIAHTGNARGLIFAQGSAPANAQSRLRDAGFKMTLQFTAGGGRA